MAERPVLLAAGGTGGHLFPAEATAAALSARGFAVELATDDRALRYSGGFAFRAVHRIPSATPRGGSIASKVEALAVLARGLFAARGLLKRMQPLCVVGFGGYPTVPPMLAAAQLKIPTLLHEQNAVMGKANRFLAPRMTALAGGFRQIGRLDPELAKGRFVHTGNPLRPMAVAATKIAYPDFSSGRFDLLVTGGSQGASIMSDVVPAACERLREEDRARLRIVQQTRREDEARVLEAYRRLGIEAEVATFFVDLPNHIAHAHLVVSRAGASTVSELAAIGRPCVLVPFPHALDQDQAANAQQLAETGAAEVIRQSDFTAELMAKLLEEGLQNPEGLTRRAEAAKSAGTVDAAERLADIVATLASSFGKSETAS